MKARTLILAAGVALLLALPPLASALGQPYYIDLLRRVMILGIAAASLNLILGYGGLVSFGHAAYLGVGGYAVGIFAFHGVHNGWLQMAVAMLASAAVAFAIGAISLRTRGIYFIMITLAFAQMLYFLVVSLREYGGDDGLRVPLLSDFGAFTLADGVTLYYASYVLLLAALYGAWRLIHARFGMVLRGCKANPRRMAALGFPTLRYRLAAYVISALVCVLAGVLLANLTRYVAPSYMAWTVSGELIVMVVLGGLGTLLGPVVGAAALLLLEELLTSLKLGVPWLDTLLNQHWLALIGLFIVFVVLVMKQGLYGRLLAREREQR
jgi:branched-chain amino acid transport system permease protein